MRRDQTRAGLPLQMIKVDEMIVLICSRYKMCADVPVTASSRSVRRMCFQVSRYHWQLSTVEYSRDVILEIIRRMCFQVSRVSSHEASTGTSQHVLQHVPGHKPGENPPHHSNHRDSQRRGKSRPKTTKQRPRTS